MPLPDYQSCMLPLLRFAADGKEHRLRDVVAALADQMKLSNDERNETLPSGNQAVFHNRVSWARTYMAKAGLLESPARGFFRITDRGRELLDENPAAINVQLLERYPEFLTFKASGKPTDAAGKEAAPTGDLTPLEALENAHERLRAELAAELLEAVMTTDPAHFENLVIDLLVRMGYGGSRRDAGRAIGRSGDEGIDGIIKEDRLGLDVIFVQAKRWQNPVGRPEIQKFAGALDGQRERKGIFITTSDFSKEAWEYVSRIDKKIILMDGKTLARYMMDFGVGVIQEASYEVLRLDLDYFTGA